MFEHYALRNITYITVKNIKYGQCRKKEFSLIVPTKGITVKLEVQGSSLAGAPSKVKRFLFYKFQAPQILHLSFIVCIVHHFRLKMVFTYTFWGLYFQIIFPHRDKFFVSHIMKTPGPVILFEIFVYNHYLLVTNVYSNFELNVSASQFLGLSTK